MANYPGNAAASITPPSGPFTHGWAITPSDTVFPVPSAAGAGLPAAISAIYVGTTGDVALQPANTLANGTSNAVVLHAVPAGTILQIAATMVFASGTTASNLVALW